MAPALNVSAAAITTEWFCFLSLSAIFAMVVVFPVPFTPMNAMWTGFSAAFITLSKSSGLTDTTFRSASSSASSTMFSDFFRTFRFVPMRSVCIVLMISSATSIATSLSSSAISSSHSGFSMLFSLIMTSWFTIIDFILSFALMSLTGFLDSVFLGVISLVVIFSSSFSWVRIISSTDFLNFPIFFFRLSNIFHHYFTITGLLCVYLSILGLLQVYLS